MKDETVFSPCVLIKKKYERQRWRKLGYVYGDNSQQTRQCQRGS